MAKKKVVTVIGEDGVELKEEVAFSDKVLLPLSVDYGREDLNTMARKINEIIEALNEK